MIVGPLLAALLVAQASDADSLRLIAMRLTESALVVEARARPLVTREALSDALTQSVKGEAEALTVAIGYLEGHGIGVRLDQGGAFSE